jgi:hypothetical protein
MQTPLVVAVVMGVLEASAAAQVAPEPVPDPANGPGFMTIDRGDATSRAGGELSYLFPRSNTGTSLTAMRFDLHGQYLDPRGFGGYGQLPISYLRESAAGMSDSASAIGDVEVGGLYVAKVNPNVAAVIRVGLTLPTAPADQKSLAANIIGELTRLDDLYQFIPKGTSARISVSPLFRQGQLFARLDVGIDTNLSADNSVSNVENIARVNAGVGYDAGNVALTAESVNLHSSGNSGSGTGSSWLNAGAVGARMNAGAVEPYAAFVFPLDHDTHQFMSAAITLGIETRLR